MWSARLLIFSCLCFLLPLNFPAHAQPQADYQIKWALSNPFRLFKDEEVYRFHELIHSQLTEEERLAPVLSTERRLAAHLPFGWAEDVMERTCWSRGTGAYENCGKTREDYINPKSHRVRLSLQGATLFERLGLTCRWTMTGMDTIKALATPLSQPCDKVVEFDVPYPKGARVNLDVSNGVKMQTNIKVEDVFVVGIGDSFASGEGNPDVPVRFDRNRFVVYGPNIADKKPGRAYPTRAGEWQFVGDPGFMEGKALWMGQSCHRSLYSHQLRASLQLALNNPQRAVTFVGFSCAGAEITHGLFLRFKGNEWSPAPPRLSQISAVAAAQCGAAPARLTRYARAFGLDNKLEILNDLPVLNCPRNKARKIDLLMLSVGGNDVGFSSLVANVIVKDTVNLKMIGGWMGRILNASQARANLSELKNRYKALRRALHNVLHIPWGEADRILLTGYPNMSFRDEGRRVCDNGDLGMTVSPVFSLSSSRAKRAEQFADRLNVIMKRTANLYRWSFVEGHREAFYSHGLCAMDEARQDNLAENLHLPFWDGKKWDPFNPADYAPYASRARWFRTPNDAYLTGHLHLSGPVIRNIFKIKGFSQLQVLIAGTYSGAFHPTAEGQAVIADAVAQRAEKVLAKYNGL